MYSEDTTISIKQLAISSLVSLLVLVFSWKEAALSRIVFQSESLDALVMYSRFILIVTFPFMLQNARIPLLLHKIDDNYRSSINKILVQKRVLILFWAAVTGSIITLCAWYFDREYFVGVRALMIGAFFLVAYGNITATLVFYREYKNVAIAYFSAFVTFLLIALLLDYIGRFSLFTSVTVASLISQIFFCQISIINLRKLIDKKAASEQSKPNPSSLQK